jgi:16S rRNA U516 pseudouridylate synthase RsuA-like enzyme
VRQLLIAALVASYVLAPVAASATLIDPSLVPDGTYVCKVEKVIDGTHLLVAMQNGVETTLIPTSASFANVKTNDTIKITLIQGKVKVYAVQ